MVNDVEISGLAAVFAAVGFVIIVIVCVRQIARQSKSKNIKTKFQNRVFLILYAFMMVHRPCES